MTYYDIRTGEEVSDLSIEEHYDEWLDEEGSVTIGGYEYAHSVAFARVDPIAYRCGLFDFESSLIGDTIVERGYWVRVITADGEEVPEFTEWYTDEDDARQAASDCADVGMDGAPEGEYFVQCYDTSDDVLTEVRVIVH